MTVTQNILLELYYNVENQFRITVWHLGLRDADLIPWPHVLINVIVRVLFSLGLYWSHVYTDQFTA